MESVSATGNATDRETFDRTAGAHETGTSTTLGRLAAGARETVHNIADRAGPAAQWIGSRVQTLNASGSKAIEDTRESVRAHPLTAVGAAVVVGAVIGYLLRRS